MSGSLQPGWAELLEGVRLESVAPGVPETYGDESGAMRAELAAAGLAELARRAGDEGRPLTFVVNDAHRFTETLAFLTAALEVIDTACAAGPTPLLRILVAQGSHRAGGAEREAHEQRLVGPVRARFAEILWHDAEDAGSHARVGAYDFNAWMAGGGLYVACGSVEPHYFAGATGAHKTVTVGVMSRAAIETNHAAAMSRGARALRFDGNPVHEGVVAALAALVESGASLIALNQVIVGARVVAVSAGSPLAALERALPAARACYARSVERPLDLIVARVGAPLDRDLYQSDKGIKNTEAAVADGGVLIVESQCREGVGIDHFVDLLREAPSYAAACAVVDERGYRLGDHKAVRLRALTDCRGVRVALVSGRVDAALGRALAIEVFAERTAAAAWARSLLGGRGAHGLVVEDAGNLSLELA